MNGQVEVCTKCGHQHRGGRPNGGTVCDVQIRHAGADADQDAYCKCPAPEPISGPRAVAQLNKATGLWECLSCGNGTDAHKADCPELASHKAREENARVVEQ